LTSEIFLFFSIEKVLESGSQDAQYLGQILQYPLGMVSWMEQFNKHIKCAYLLHVLFPLLPTQSENGDNSKQHREFEETHGVLVVELVLEMVDDVGEGGEVGRHRLLQARWGDTDCCRRR
jgi:hypothetical protein